MEVTQRELDAARSAESSAAIHSPQFKFPRTSETEGVDACESLWVTQNELDDALADIRRVEKETGA
jgi:hypothetical protein